MGIPADIIRENRSVGIWNILHCWRGSIAHSTYRPDSEPNSIDDKDTMGLCVPPLEYYIGLDTFGLGKGTKEIKRNEFDIVVYEARKGIRLLAKGNPNVLSLLWLPENMYLDITDAGKLLLDRKKVFVGRHVYYPFVGYAKAQLHKMTHQAYEGYMGKKRKALVDRYGYDTKNASHLIRILRMGIEFLKDGELHVNRAHDRTELLAIKDGEWSLDRVKSESDRLFKLAEETHAQSDLPKGPDPKVISTLCHDVVFEELFRRGEIP